MVMVVIISSAQIASCSICTQWSWQVRCLCLVLILVADGTGANSTPRLPTRYVFLVGTLRRDSCLVACRFGG